MAYNPASLSALSYANGFTLWYYRTPDPAATVDNTGYFNAAASMLRVGDFIFGNCNTGGTIESGVFVVRLNSGGVVDVSNITSFGALNSD
jgi:hypothetical protein